MFQPIFELYLDHDILAMVEAHFYRIELSIGTEIHTGRVEPNPYDTLCWHLTSLIGNKLNSFVRLIIIISDVFKSNGNGVKCMCDCDTNIT